MHRADCVNLGHLLESQSERVVTVRWSPREGSLFLVAIQVEALDRTGLLSDVTRSISDQHVNILSASVTTTQLMRSFRSLLFSARASCVVAIAIVSANVFMQIMFLSSFP